jgi:hypothetical protein
MWANFSAYSCVGIDFCYLDSVKVLTYTCLLTKHTTWTQATEDTQGVIVTLWKMATQWGQPAVLAADAASYFNSKAFKAALRRSFGEAITLKVHDPQCSYQAGYIERIHGIGLDKLRVFLRKDRGLFRPEGGIETPPRGKKVPEEEDTLALTKEQYYRLNPQNTIDYICFLLNTRPLGLGVDGNPITPDHLVFGNRRRNGGVLDPVSDDCPKRIAVLREEFLTFIAEELKIKSNQSFSRKKTSLTATPDFTTGTAVAFIHTSRCKLDQRVDFGHIVSRISRASVQVMRRDGIPINIGNAAVIPLPYTMPYKPGPTRVGMMLAVEIPYSPELQTETGKYSDWWLGVVLSVTHTGRVMVAWRTGNVPAWKMNLSRDYDPEYESDVGRRHLSLHVDRDERLSEPAREDTEERWNWYIVTHAQFILDDAHLAEVGIDRFLRYAVSKPHATPSPDTLGDSDLKTDTHATLQCVACGKPHVADLRKDTSHLMANENHDDASNGITQIPNPPTSVGGTPRKAKSNQNKAKLVLKWRKKDDVSNQDIVLHNNPEVPAPQPSRKRH